MGRFLLLNLSLHTVLGLLPVCAVSFAQTTPIIYPSAPDSAAASDAKTVKVTPKIISTTKPVWSDIKPEQQAALLPLQSEWPRISENQKRKWLEISKNFSKLQLDEQNKLHSRMKDWVGLSSQERAQARLNFSTAKALTSEEKQKRWEAYQSLSPEEKQKLHSNAKASAPNSAALANKSQNKVTPSTKLQPPPRQNDHTNAQ
jgi:Protein of unknown function (DUF3106)